MLKNIFMSKVYRCLVAVFCLVVFPNILYSEGTKQVKPTSAAKGQLCINKSRNDFAFYDASPEFRLNIAIAYASEAIRFGFGRVIGTNSTDLLYRIKDPAGNIVFGPLSVPSSGAGFINTYTEAVNGPFLAAGGYDYLSLLPSTTGNYYLEFYYPPSSGIYNDNNRLLLEFFDISVVNAAGNAVDGRVWSKAWQFWSEIPDDPPTSNRFYGKMMILSDDSIVTQINCNGFIGGTFSFSSNMTGCATTGNLPDDRMSRPGFFTYPQYKVFLNDPDSILFPTKKMTAGIVPPVTVFPNCTTGGADFGIKVAKDGTVKLLVEINPSPGADPEDVLIIANVKANPGGMGYNTIIWNGYDNKGNPVSSSTNLAFTVTYLSGLTHLPLYDIENNDNGFIVQQIRPKGEQLKIYWDDTRISGGTSNTATGCISPSGCHTWNNSFGNNNTINSWWFVTWSEIPGTTFVTKKMPGHLSINGSSLYCTGTGSLMYSVAAEPNSTSYNWSYSGTGVTFAGTGPMTTLNFAPDATPGILSVYGHNDACGNGQESLFPITFEPIPDVALVPFPDMCYTAPGFRLAGGNPEGGVYFVDGIMADSLYPYKEPEGLHTIVYAYTAPSGCSNSDAAEILLRKGPDCEGTLIFPNAFTPDGDGLNDKFRPVVHNICRFILYIYSRWGQLIYSTEDEAIGWDGTFRGVACPGGVYAYTVTYGLSLRTDENKTERGVFALIR